MDRDPSFAPPLSALIAGTTGGGVSGATVVNPAAISGFPSDPRTHLAGDGRWPITRMYPIASAALTAAAATIDFLNIPQTFTHLMAIGNFGNDSAVRAELQCRVNNDSSTNYQYTEHKTDTVVTVTNGVSTAQWRLGLMYGNAAASGNVAILTQLTMFLSNYTSSTLQQTFLSSLSQWDPGVSRMVIYHSGGYHQQSAPTTSTSRLTFLSGTGNITKNSAVTLYGF